MQHATPPNLKTPPRLLPAKTAAQEIGLKYTTLRDIAFRGEIRVIKIGRRWFFDRNDIDAFITARKESLAR